MMNSATIENKIVKKINLFLFIIIGFKYYTMCYCLYSKKRGQITSSTLFWHRQTPCNPKRVKAHAIRRELRLLFLIDFFQFPNCPKQESKSGCSSYMSILYLSQPIGICGFKGSTYVICYYPLTAKVQGILLVSVQGVEEMIFPSKYQNVCRQKQYTWHWLQMHNPRICHHHGQPQSNGT